MRFPTFRMDIGVSPSIRKTIRVLAASLAVIFLICFPAFSQTYTGRILGSVTDQSGGVMVGATVVITDTQRDISRTVVTDQSGDYVVPDLLPSTYKVVAQAKGFKTVERLNIRLEVAQDVRLDFALQPGEASQTVTVTEEVPLLNTTNGTLGGTLSNATINALPLNGRNFENLITLRPGAVIYPGGGFQTQSANGLRPADVGYLLDGVENQDPFQGQSIVNQAGFAGDASTILPIDSIQQFNVMENPPAQYGWHPGAVVNVALKSGTNQFHGTAYAFGRDDSFDARNFFNTVGHPKTPLELEQYGGTAGGPILKNKFFFFAGYEGQRYSVGNTFPTIIPVAASLAPGPSPPNCSFTLSGDCANSIPDAIADLQAGGFSLSPVSQKLVTLFPTNLGPSTLFPLGFPNSITARNGVAKLDYHVNERNTVSYDYFVGDQSGTAETREIVAPEFISEISERAQAHGLHWTWNPNPRWVNVATFAYDRFRQGPTTTKDSSMPASAFLGVPTGVTNPLLGGLPNILISGFLEGFPGDGIGGDFILPKLLGTNNIYDFSDSVSYLHGKHAFTFGGELQHWIVTAGRFSNGRGKIKFGPGGAFASATPLEDFLAGFPSVGIIQVGNALRRVNQWAYDFFFQDDWRMTPRLTMNLGLRYEYTTPMRAAQGLLGNFDPNIGLIQQGLGGIDTVYRGDHSNVSPRLGFAWDPTGAGKTVIRGGASLIYSRIELFSLLSQLGPSNNVTTGLAAVPTGAVGVQPAGGTIDTGLVVLPISPMNYNVGPVFAGATPLVCNAGSPCPILGVDRDLRNPSVITWTLGVQHSFTNDLSLEVAYVGDHGRNLLGIRDINQPPVGAGYGPGCGAPPPPGNPGCEAAAVPFFSKFPFLSNINFLSNQDRSNYNSLQITATQRTSHGLSLVASYTFSHALDDASNNSFAFQPQDNTRPGLEYGNSDFDIRHRLTLTATYALPGIKSFAQLLQGWNITSIVTLQGGQPWYAADFGDDISGTGEVNDRWDFFGRPGDFSSGPNPIPFFPGASNPACANKALALDGGTPGAFTTALGFIGCYAKGSSIMIPPPLGTFGTLGRNVFRASRFYSWDASIFKDWKFGEQLTAQFRAEFFNVLNHPLFANPYGSANGFGQNDASSPSTFGCGCATPDVAASNPVLGSGGNRAIQLGLKLIF